MSIVPKLAVKCHRQAAACGVGGEDGSLLTVSLKQLSPALPAQQKLCSCSWSCRLTNFRRDLSLRTPGASLYYMHTQMRKHEISALLVGLLTAGTLISHR